MDINNIFKNIVQPNELQNKVTILEERLPAVLDDFKKYYVFFNKNPTYSEYQNIYNNLQDNLNSINTELLEISNTTQKNSKNISDYLIKLNQSIEEEKKKNRRFKLLENKITNNYGDSKIMIDEYKQLYNDDYIKNVLIVFGILVSGITLFKVFSNKGQN
jgi:CCR4-NOT transcriptional regulation complex NOT5 subunit